MKVVKVVRNTALIAAFVATTAFLSGCGGVSDAEMAQLNSLKSEVSSLQSQANSLKDERANLEKEIAAKTDKLAQCNKEKEETKANLEKLSSN
jgi:outer membrane murein-binding lipoprotein Lpp